MILSLLLNGVNAKVFGETNIEISSLSFSSGNAKADCLFFCLQGTKTNGEKYIKEALFKGAIAVVLTKKKNLKSLEKKLNIKITQIVVKDVRKAMAVMSANFYGNPQKKLKIVGITGTNGKTSTSYITAEILRKSGKKVGVIGTSGIFINEKKLPAVLTTPDSLELFYLFNEMLKNGVEIVVMEVSAHAIFYDKVYGVDFFVKALTNVQSDHLDFFKTQKNYENTKMMFFETGNNFVINADSVGLKIISQFANTNGYIDTNRNANTNSEINTNNSVNTNCSINTNSNINTKSCLLKNNHLNFIKNIKAYSFENNIKNIVLTEKGSSFIFMEQEKEHFIKTNLPGKFNVLNVVCAINICLFFGLQIDKIINIVSQIKKLDGRLDLVYSKKFNVFIDYAHTSEGLKNLLETVSQISKNKNIIVFGCPGERDSIKRAEMGEIAGKYCETVIVTTDNPASENPRRIMAEIAVGIGKTPANVLKIENRKLAIRKAIKLATESKQKVKFIKKNKSYLKNKARRILDIRNLKIKKKNALRFKKLKFKQEYSLKFKNDLAKAGYNILIVGKGTEQEQIISDYRKKYCDYDVVKKLLLKKQIKKNVKNN